MTQNNVKATVTKELPAAQKKVLRSAKTSGHGSKEKTAEKMRVACCRSIDGEPPLLRATDQAKKRTAELMHQTLPVARPKRPRLGIRVLAHDNFGMETFLSVQQCLDTLSQRLSKRREDMQHFIAHRVGGRISDFDCPDLASDFPGDVIDCSTHPVTILLTEFEQGVRLVALVVKENPFPVRVLPSLPEILEKNIEPRHRRCSYINHPEEGRCNCTTGHTYSFGCAWNMYQSPKACKFSRTAPEKLTRCKMLGALANADSGDLVVIGRSSLSMTNSTFSLLEQTVRRWAKAAGELMKRSIPTVFATMRNKTSCTRFIDPDNSVFTGATAVVDYSCHPHKDYNNMVGGATAVISFNGEKVGLSICTQCP